MSTSKPKVFGIGLSKTGTSSLTTALNILGYKAKHFPLRLLRYNNGKLEIDLGQVGNYDAITDIPIARFYQKLYHTFPDSKFILTTRNLEGWLDSCRRHFWPGQIIKSDNWINQLHKDIYNSIDFDREKFENAYLNHKKEVLSFFEDKENRLLVLDIINGDGWKMLCKFLDKPVPQAPFPHTDCFYTKIFKILNIQRFRK